MVCPRTIEHRTMEGIYYKYGSRFISSSSLVCSIWPVTTVFRIENGFKNSFIMKGICALAIVLVTVAISKVGAITKCQGIDMSFTEEQVMHMKDCMDLVGITNIHELGIENAGCFSKCAMQKKGLIDGDGKPHKEKITNMFDASVPENLRAGLRTEIEKCLEAEGDKIDVKEEDCSSFLPLSMCVHSAFTNLC